MTELWTPTDTIRATAGTKARSANFNAALDNLDFLYGGPRVTLWRNSDLTVPYNTREEMEWSTALVDQTAPYDRWFYPETNNIVVPRDGVYLISITYMWDSETGGDRQVRLLRDGNPIRDQRHQGVIHTADTLTVQCALEDGQALSVDFFHNDDTQSHSIVTRSSPIRSPIFMANWIAPFDAVV